MGVKKAPKPDKTVPKLRPLHKAFIAEYLINGNNATQAVRTTNPSVTHGSSAAAVGSRLLSRANVQTEIQAVIDQADLGIKVRTGVLKSILSRSTSECMQYNGEGKLVSTTTVNASKDQLKAIDLINKMDGTYARSEAVGHAQGKLLEPLMAEWSRRIREELRNAPTAHVEEQGEVIQVHDIDSDALTEADAATHIVDIEQDTHAD